METSQYKYDHSWRDGVMDGKKRKTYGRLLGMIFLGGVGSTLAAERQ
jgi:hypothetical protein